MARSGIEHTPLATPTALGPEVRTGTKVIGRVQGVDTESGHTGCGYRKPDEHVAGRSAGDGPGVTVDHQMRHRGQQNRRDERPEVRTVAPSADDRIDDGNRPDHGDGEAGAGERDGNDLGEIEADRSAERVAERRRPRDVGKTARGSEQRQSDKTEDGEPASGDQKRVGVIDESHHRVGRPPARAGQHQRHDGGRRTDHPPTLTEIARRMGALFPQKPRSAQLWCALEGICGKLLRMEPLDAIDRRIVAELRHDGRVTINELAERVGLSGSPTLRRLRRLEADGVIRGYRADVDPQTIGRGFSVWVTARLAVGDPDAQKAFEDGLRSLPAVTEAHHVTGDVDYLVRVDVEDLAAYDHVIRNELATLPGQAHITSYVVTSTAIPPR